jgi:hypothetical protein
MIIFAIVLLMAASALFTAAAFVQVQGHTDMKIPHVGSMEPRASLWLFLSGLLAVAVGSFFYSRSQGANATVELVLFLFASISPLVIIRFIHNRKVVKKQATV